MKTKQNRQDWAALHVAMVELVFSKLLIEQILDSLVWTASMVYGEGIELMLKRRKKTTKTKPLGIALSRIGGELKSSMVMRRQLRDG